MIITIINNIIIKIIDINTITYYLGLFVFHYYYGYNITLVIYKYILFQFIGEIIHTITAWMLFLEWKKFIIIYSKSGLYFFFIISL